MADDEHADARDPQVAAWLETESLDEVTRRRLVSTAMRETGQPTRGPSRAWRWVAAAAAVVLVAVGTLAVVTAGGGHDEEQASTPVRTPEAAGSAAPKALGTVPNVGDFGDLDDAANLVKLRSAFAAAAPASEPPSAGDASRAESTADAGSAFANSACGDLFGNATILARGTGTLDGRPATVYITQQPDGTRAYDAVIDDTCELRHLS